MRNATVFRSSFVLVLIAPAAAFAVDLAVPGSYATIDAALEAAQPGDRVIVTGGRYQPLDVTKSDVELVGRRAVIAGGGFISGDRVKVRGFSFVSKQSVGGSLEISGDDVRVEDNLFRFLAVQSTGDRTAIVSNISHKGSLVGGAAAEIVGNRIDGCGSLIVGADSLIERNTAPRRDFVNVFTDAPSVVIRSNRVSNIHANSAHGAVIEQNVTRGDLQAWGDDVSVAHNRTLHGFIGVTGDRAVVDSNRVGRAVFGIHVEGDLPTVTGNVVVARAPNRDPYHPSQVTWEPGIVVTGAVTGGTIGDNVVRHFRGPGIVVTADNAQVADNTVHGESAQTSIAVFGSANTLSGNDVAHSGWNAQSDGIAVTGRANEIRDTRVTGTSHAAVVVNKGDGNTVSNVVVESDSGSGIVVTDRASGTSVIDCDVSGCRIGLVASETMVTGTTLVSNRVADLLDMGGVTLGGGNRIGVVVGSPYLE